MKKCIVLAPIAEREILFFSELVKNAKQENWPVEFQFISFYQAGNEYLRSLGCKVWDTYEWIEKTSEFKISKSDLESYFDNINIHALSLHEKVTFGVTEYENLYEKYFKFLNGLNLVLSEIEKKFSASEVLVMQELGGFIAPLSLLFNCKKKKIDHVFFEPSFFKCTMHFVENSLFFKFPSVSQIDKPVEQNALEYLEKTRAMKALVIPQKDLHHYQDMGFRKVFNFSNFRKLWAKIKIKYLSNQKQEYEIIGNHVQRTLRQLLNRIQMGSRYVQNVPKQPYIYFPFHVQLDVQLTIRNPEYLNQLAFVELLCQVAPQKYKIVAKEHPISIGGFSAAFLKRLQDQYSNFVLLNPLKNTYEVLEGADAIVTINSKVGAEALSLGKKVACMGNGFYWNSGIVNKFSGPEQLKEWLQLLSRDQIKKTSMDQVNSYFSEIYRNSFPFELYNLEKANVQRFSDSIKKYLNR